MTGERRSCEWCGDGLITHRQGARFCDDHCRNEWHNEKRRNRSARNAPGKRLQPARRPLTQRERVLHELREAGSTGVRSDRFYEMGIPRAGARIYELKGRGHSITSEHEGQFVRYRLVEFSAGVSESARPEGDVAFPGSGSAELSQSVDPGLYIEEEGAAA